MSVRVSERTVGDVVIIDFSGKITPGDGGDTMLKDKVRSLLSITKLLTVFETSDSEAEAITSFSASV